MTSPDRCWQSQPGQRPQLCLYGLRALGFRLQVSQLTRPDTIRRMQTKVLESWAHVSLRVWAWGVWGLLRSLAKPELKAVVQEPQ